MGPRPIQLSRCNVTTPAGDTIASRAFVYVRDGIGRVLVDRHEVATMAVHTTVIEGNAAWRLEGPDGVWVVRKVACCGGG